MAFSEFRFWSPIADTVMVRISMTNGKAQGEYFAFIPAYDGRRYRERRDEALDMIETAIREGLEPGEVLPA